MVPKPELLRLYRHTLHAAANFPSIKRAGLLSEIKQAWRQDRVLTDAKQVEQKQKLAQDSLQQLRQYVGMRQERPTSDVFLGGGAPMQPKPTSGGLSS